jgi:N-acetylmuramoyl-L-alanine amidase
MKRILLFLLLVATSSIADGRFAQPVINSEAQLRSVVISHTGNRPDNNVFGLELMTDSQELFLKSHDVASMLLASRFWEPELRRLTVKVNGHKVVFLADNRFINVDGKGVMLRAPVYLHEGDLWLPMEAVTSIFPALTGQSVQWDRARGRLEYGTALYNVRSLTVESGNRVTFAKLHCSKKIMWRTDTPTSSTVRLKLYGALVDTSIVKLEKESGLLSNVSVVQLEEYALVTFKLNRTVNSFRTFSEKEGNAIVLQLEETRKIDLPAPRARGYVNMAKPMAAIDGTESISIKTIVIDAGHGGLDAGKIGTRGTQEKTINLNLAEILSRKFRSAGFEVVLTRDSDILIDLDVRSERANLSGGDLMISLHCNGWFNSKPNGIETWFFQPELTTPPGAGGFVRWERVQELHLVHSSDLAEIIQKSLIDETGATSRGVKRESFKVLRGANMPAVLLETGFLSNSKEEKKLSSKRYLSRLADGIVDAVIIFRDKHQKTEEATP